MPLTQKRRLFLSEYVKDGNGQRAAIAAGFSERRAAVTASEILRDPDVKEALAVINRKAEEQATITAADVMRRAWEIASEDKPDRVAALTLLSKRFPEFSDKVEDITTEKRIEHVMNLIGCTREEAESAVAEAERVVGARN